MRLRFDASLPFHSRRLASIAFCGVATLALALSSVRAQQFDYDPDGFWKMPQAQGTKGEFSGEDPIGLASRQHIPTDCAIHWKDEDGKTYCFSSSMSSQLFQDERRNILPKASAFWAKEHHEEHPRGSDAAITTTPAAPPSGSQRPR